MSNCATDFAFSNQEQCFVVLETTCGTLKKPTAASAIYTVGPVDFGQDRELLEDEQIRPFASKLASIKARLTPGDFSFTTYAKPSGTLGTAPEQDVLFQCLMGTKTATPVTKVEYTLATQLDSFSLWVLKGHTAFALRGCTIDKAEITVSGDAIVQIKWSGKFMERLWAGTTTAPGDLGIPDTLITPAATGALRYCPGMYIKVGTDDNAGTGYLISDVNYTLNTITISTGLVAESGTGATIAPWLPTAAAEVGAPVHGKVGIVTVGGQDAVVLSASVSFTNNIKYFDNLKNGVWTAESFARPGKRSVEGSLSMHFLQSSMSYYYRADYLITNALIIPAGDVAGKIMEISIPYAEYRTPKLSGNEEFLVDVPFVAIASGAGNDEAKITLK